MGEMKRGIGILPVKRDVLRRLEAYATYCDGLVSAPRALRRRRIADRGLPAPAKIVPALRA